MGLSISASVAIIFIASAIVFGTLLGAFSNAEHAMLDAQREAQTRAVEETNTHLVVSSINTDNGTVAITNEGDITLSIGKIDLFIDGVLSNGRITSRTIMGSGPTDLWMPGEDLVLTISGDLTGASIKVVCENGSSAHL